MGFTQGARTIFITVVLVNEMNYSDVMLCPPGLLPSELSAGRRDEDPVILSSEPV